MTEFIRNLIGNDYIASLIMSIIPLIELKGGIVFARGVGIGFFEALGLCYLGSTLVFIPIFFLLRPILNLLKKIKWINKFATGVENYFSNKAGETLEKRKAKSGDNGISETEGKRRKPLSEKALKQLGVFIFVAIPLPMTGVWTGTAIAVFLGLNFKDVILPVVLGNLVAGTLISLLAELLLAVWTIAALDYVLWGLFGLALILLVVTIIKMAKSKKKNSDEQDKEQNT